MNFCEISKWTKDAHHVVSVQLTDLTSAVSNLMLIIFVHLFTIFILFLPNSGYYLGLDSDYWSAKQPTKRFVEEFGAVL